MLPIAIRIGLLWEKRQERLYSSHGSFLDIFQSFDDELRFEQNVHVFDEGVCIDQVTSHPQGLLLAGDHHIALFDATLNCVVARFWHTDHIVRLKWLDEGQIVVLTAKKNLCLFVVEEGSFLLKSTNNLDGQATIFSGCILGSSWEDLTVYTGGILGVIHAYQPAKGMQSVLTINGHWGMVFAIAVYRDLLYSIGDDRSVRCFHRESGNELAAVYGHGSRIRSLAISEDGRVFSGDEAVCVWEWTGHELNMVEKLELGVGKVMGLCVRDTSRFFAASVNGSLVAVHLSNRQNQLLELPWNDALVVRAFVKLADDEYVITNDKKDLIWSKNGKNEIFIGGEVIRFDSLRLSDCGRLIAAASDSKVFLIERASRKYCTVVVKDVLGGFCFDGDELFVVAKDGTGRSMTLAGGVFNQELWNFGRGLPVKCATKIDDGRIVFGLSKGYLEVYSRLQPEHALQTIRVGDGTDPVMAMRWIDHRLFVITRDGKCTVFDVTDSGLGMAETFATMEKPAGFLNHDLQTFVWGFRAADFVICPLRSTHPVAVYGCGGGNRICDVFPVVSDDKTLVGVRFEHIVRGVFKLLKLDLAHVVHIVGPFHRHNVYGAAVIPSAVRGNQLVITGGIDTQVVLSEVDNVNGRLKPLWRSAAHESSIHAVDCLRRKCGTEVVATAGGKSEIRLWALTPKEDALQVLAKYRREPDFRYFAIELAEVEDLLFVAGVCSIREFHVLKLKPAEKKLEEVVRVECPDYSTFIDLALSTDSCTAFLVATSGSAYCCNWSVEGDSTIVGTEAFSSGFSAVCNFPDPACPKRCVVGTEGGSLAIVEFCEVSGKIVFLMDYLHYSTVSGLCALAKATSHWFIASIATDGRFLLTQVRCTGGCFDASVTKTVSLSVGDPVSLKRLSTAEDRDTFIVTGQGLEVVRC